MEYRLNQKTGERISVMGLGSAYTADMSEADIATIAVPSGAISQRR